MPTLRAIECLVAVVDAGSVTEAAERLHASQPAVSHQLAALEREIGTPLLERLPRGVRPTVAGRSVVAHARAALIAAERVVADGRAIAAGQGGRIRVGCAASLTGPVLSVALRTWRADHADVDITISEASSADELARLVLDDEADLALCPRPTSWVGQMEVVGRESVLAVMSVDHRWVHGGTVVARADLDGEPAVHYPPGNGLGAWIDGVLAADGVALDARVRTQFASTAAELAAAGLGVAMVPASAIPMSYSGVARELDPPLIRDIVVLTPGSADAVVADFVAHLVSTGLPATSGDPPIG